MATGAARVAAWNPLGMSARELRLEHSLPTGQSFRWRQTSADPVEFTGVVGRRLVQLRQSPDDVLYRVLARGSGEKSANDAVALEDYFQKPVVLSKLSALWCSRDERYSQIHPYVMGARMLRQDPVECLFSFICSSNNHISRIQGMVDRLASRYGDPLHLPDDPDAQFFAFPTLEQLSAASEEALRADGFGYRAKFIVGSVQALQSKPEGGSEWLLALRKAGYQEALLQLQTLPGIGPKVAACVALFSLDKAEAIPVDTHVWQLAIRYYCPNLADKTLTPRIHGEVQQAFETVFGEHCGWAHNALFISELASIRATLPDHLRAPPLPPSPPKPKAAAKKGVKTAPAKAKSAKGNDNKPTAVAEAMVTPSPVKRKAAAGSPPAAPKKSKPPAKAGAEATPPVTPVPRRRQGGRAGLRRALNSPEDPKTPQQ